MGLKELQSEVDVWMNQFKVPYWTPHEILARLVEETGELAREVNCAYGPKNKKVGEKENSIEDELGDILFTILGFANSQKIDLDESFKKVMDKCYKRDNQRYERKDAQCGN
jgi:NTP pyrophosphatase (non-canonical NTP hydrolase)